MALTSRFTRRLTSVRFQDANGLGMTVGPGEGNLSMGEWNADFAEHIRVLDRDRFDAFVVGEDNTQDCSITVQQVNESLTHATLSRIEDFIHKRGAFAAAVSVADEVWAWVTIVTFTSSSVTTTRTLPMCTGGSAFAEGNPTNTFSINFTNHQIPVDA